MSEAVIVSTARTAIGKAARGSFNLTHGTALAGHAIEHAVERSKVDPKEIEDAIIGCGLPENATGHNIGRNAAIRAGLPVTVAGATVEPVLLVRSSDDRMAAQRIIVDEADCIVAGGVECISLTQNGGRGAHRSPKTG